jgi:hypothetical protein
MLSCLGTNLTLLLYRIKNKMELKMLNLILTWKGIRLPNKRYSWSSLVIQLQRRVLTQSRNYPQFLHPKFQYHLQNSPSPTPHPERDQSSPRPPMLFNIHFNSILPSTPRSSKWSFSFTFPPPKPYMYFSFFPNLTHVLPILSRSPRNIV